MEVKEERVSQLADVIEAALRAPRLGRSRDNAAYERDDEQCANPTAALFLRMNFPAR